MFAGVGNCEKFVEKLSRGFIVVISISIPKVASSTILSFLCGVGFIGSPISFGGTTLFEVGPTRCAGFDISPLFSDSRFVFFWLHLSKIFYHI